MGSWDAVNWRRKVRRKKWRDEAKTGKWCFLLPHKQPWARSARSPPRGVRMKENRLPALISRPFDSPEARWLSLCVTGRWAGDANETLLLGSLWECFQMTLAFEWARWVKRTALSRVWVGGGAYQMHHDKGIEENGKRQRKGGFVLSAGPLS